jgi:hypothetical protein
MAQRLSTAAFGFAGAALFSATQHAGPLLQSAGNALVAVSTPRSSDAAIQALAQQVITSTSTLSVALQTLGRGDSSGRGSGLYLSLAASAALALCFYRAEDLLWVSRGVFRSGLQTVGSGLEALSKALGRVKAALSEKLDSLSARVDSGFRDTRKDIEALGDQVDRCELLLLAVNERQALGNAGIHALCSFVSSAGEPQREAKSKAAVEAIRHRFAEPPAVASPRTMSIEEQLQHISRISAAA